MIVWGARRWLSGKSTIKVRRLLLEVGGSANVSCTPGCQCLWRGRLSAQTHLNPDGLIRTALEVTFIVPDRFLGSKTATESILGEPLQKHVQRGWKLREVDAS